MNTNGYSRRGFLQWSALTLGGLGLEGARLGMLAHGPSVALIVPPDDRVAASTEVQWAIARLRAALEARGVPVASVAAMSGAAADAARVVVAHRNHLAAGTLLTQARAVIPSEPEAQGVVRIHSEGPATMLASGADARGLMYAVLELLDRVEYGQDPVRDVAAGPTAIERAHNTIRAIGRPFVSPVEDAGWYHGRTFWPDYFEMLARQRYNRFHLAFGFGYDSLRGVTDAYLLYPYPFLVGVPGYAVRVSNLSDAERDRNLESLRFISREAARHGIDFQLGMWTHGYVWDASPQASHVIEGLTPATQAAYSRDALTAVLQACPDIRGVTLRTHYESGVHEGSYAFWQTIFDGVPRAGRRLNLELHMKGLDQKLVDQALTLGIPVHLSPKYWAEHHGLPYNQTAIRELELPRLPMVGDSFAALSLGLRNHTRYGYADFLREDRPYGIVHRVFPGTHKFLLSGDPAAAAANARAFAFCGSDGGEYLEPLSFKGRRGSGMAGGRDGYADRALATPVDWQKFHYTYLVWGRTLYNPATDASVWERRLRADYGSRGPAAGEALAQATRLLSLVTTAHMPSAAQDTFSPEFYTNQSIPVADAPSPYGDTPLPKKFGTVSPIDPEVFASIDEYVITRLKDRAVAKYHVGDVARWLDGMATAASSALNRIAGDSGRQPDVAARRLTIDVQIQVCLGRFFAAKFRSAALYSVFEQTHDRTALEAAIETYRYARGAWAGVMAAADGAYVPNITFGPLPHQSGHWRDRLPAIDADIEAMAAKLPTAAAGAPTEVVRRLMAEIQQAPARPPLICHHEAPTDFMPGAAVEIAIRVTEPAAPVSVRLWYRHVNQAERYVSAEMTVRDGRWVGTVPAAYTTGPYPLQWYADIRTPHQAWLYPGLDAALTSQPYVVIRQRRA